jgi:hypothetical protein
MLPTRCVEHALERCPFCNYQLQGHSLDYTREVIELPQPQPVEVIEHRVIKRFCPHCRRWRSPKLDLRGQVLGQGRLGTHIASLVAFLALVLRLPMRRIQAYLRLVHQLTISTGEVVELLHAVRRALQGHLDTLKKQARASPILHKEAHADDALVVGWAQKVRALYDEAQEWLREHPEPSYEARELEYVALVTRAHALGKQYAQVKKHPCQALAKRLLRHEDELFQFVLIAGLSADNNLAERSIRPLVVIRKISGGSRSEEGTKTRLALASLFETWQARGLNPLQECQRLLGQPTTS